MNKNLPKNLGQITCIVQARSDSKRFKNKVLKSVGDKTAIEYQMLRLLQSKNISNILVATTNEKSDDKLCDLLNAIQVQVFRGNEDNVLDRFASAMQNFPSSNTVIRITGDCPLIDANLIDEMLVEFREKEFEYYSTDESFPDGMDVEIFSKDLLFAASIHATDKFDLEHVTPWIKRNASRVSYKKSDFDYKDVRVTLDEKSDLDVIREVIKFFNPIIDYTWIEVAQFLNTNTEIKKLNSHILRNEGQVLGTGQKLWKKSKSIIPTGNHLLSKNSDQILPDLWPAYFDKTLGCEVWDLDQNKYIDVSFMGVGTNTLGYNNSYVDSKVAEAISKGNMSTLNAPEEVYLAERLLEIHPHFDQVRFARTGGEANAIAIRLARAATGHEKVAICGYHGWHDWYLSTNLKGDSELSTHLLPGLSPSGVPKALKDTTFAFKYGDREGFINLIQSNDFAAVIMEFARSSEPDIEFINLVRAETKKRGIVLIFDECSSGFRDFYGGMHLGHQIYPDLAMFGKALGNGYAITAVLGIESVMTHAEDTFISSTFWTERIGFVAGLATLKEMQTVESWKTITKMGKGVQEFWKKIAITTNLPIKVGGFPAIASYSFDCPENLLYKTYITQEMLKKGYLASNVFYASIAHTDSVMEKYFEDFTDVLLRLRNLINSGAISNSLDARICKGGFGRLN